MYNRLFTKILDSSIWLEPDSTRIVWVTLLASMDQDGFCHFSALENLASRARVSVAKCRRAIECFESPDTNSENLANEGRRIERVPGGYLVLNAEYYRNKFTREIEREQTRLRVAKHRANKAESNKPSVTKPLQSVSPVSVSSSVPVSKSKPDQKQVIEFFGNEAMANDFWDYYESNGWRVGRNPMKDWGACARRWKRQNGSNKNPTSQNPRIAGTALEGTASQYRGIGKIL